MRQALVALAVICQSASLSAQGRAADEAAIRAHAVAIENALNKRDAAALALLFTTDADEVNLDGPRTAGREAMRGSWAADLAKWSPTLRFTLTVTGIRFIGPDSAIVETTGRFNEGAVRATRGTWVIVRENGKWLITMLRVYPAQRQE
jgi:uncharacterized protein (TIGR02246 family)